MALELARERGNSPAVRELKRQFPSVYARLDESHIRKWATSLNKRPKILSTKSSQISNPAVDVDLHFGPIELTTDKLSTWSCKQVRSFLLFSKATLLKTCLYNIYNVVGWSVGCDGGWGGGGGGGGASLFRFWSIG